MNNSFLHSMSQVLLSACRSSCTCIALYMLEVALLTLQLHIHATNYHDMYCHQAELVFGLKTLQFKPPLEELRAQYYKEMKKFVGRSK
jgi:hypothetical protein